jgi:hypothetical protein
MSPNAYFLFAFPNQIFREFLMSFMCATCPSQIIVPDIICLIVSTEEDKL